MLCPHIRVTSPQQLLEPVPSEQLDCTIKRKVVQCVSATPFLITQQQQRRRRLIGVFAFVFGGLSLNKYAAGRVRYYASTQCNQLISRGRVLCFDARLSARSTITEHGKNFPFASVT